MKALHATRTASWPVVAVIGVVSHAVRIVPHSITSSAGTSDRIIRLPHASQHGLRLPRLEQPLVSDMGCDCRSELQEKSEQSQPHSLVLILWRYRHAKGTGDDGDNHRHKRLPFSRHFRRFGNA